MTMPETRQRIAAQERVAVQTGTAIRTAGGWLAAASLLIRSGDAAVGRGCGGGRGGCLGRRLGAGDVAGRGRRQPHLGGGVDSHERVDVLVMAGASAKPKGACSDRSVRLAVLPAATLECKETPHKSRGGTRISGASKNPIVYGASLRSGC